MSWKKDPETDIDFTATATGATSTSTSTSTALPATLRRGRTIVAASLIAVAAVSLTACGSGQNSPKPSTKVSTSPDPVNRSKEAAALGNAAANEDADTGRKSRETEKSGGQSIGASGNKAGGDSPTSGTGTDTGSAAGSGAADGSGSASHGKGGNGTWTGVLKYLAPGKLTVTPASGTEQAFFVGSDTKTLGAATICASNGNVTMDSSGYGTSPCTEEQLEKAAKMDSVEVRVTVEGGVATRIAEHYHP
ncbi:hypothetical protein [Streptomyces sp. ISID311]|uniref:hypothetical protein n=1 Tax=Streptomyces sp. ISID311 TaxID=2601673 RepID=UPI0011BD3980|nr:hypothetical protein [Streptomyces sp. ISID311]TXC98588.1 hypothetical protein FS847_09825 [Streptomyces sp. ISID311]